MAKLFKTISLEERLKGSKYNELPQIPGPVQQGGTIPKPAEPIQTSEAAKLKLTPSKRDLESQLLKLTAETKKIKVLPSVGTFETTPLLKFGIPQARTTFRSSISLADRLNQPIIGSTNHLAQYFLSDQYTDYIKIKYPKAQLPQGGVDIDSISITPQQGGQNPQKSRFDVAAAQRLTLRNGVYFSHIQLGKSTFDITQAQRLVLSNGVLYSPIQTQPFRLDSLLLQGTTFSNSKYTSFIVVKSLKPIEEVAHGGIVPDKAAYVAFSPNRTSPVLRVLKYEADRLLAAYAPRVKHGSTIKTLTPATNIEQGGVTPVTTQATVEQGGVVPRTPDFAPKQGEAVVKNPTFGSQTARIAKLQGEPTDNRLGGTRYNTIIAGEVSPLLMGLSKTALGQDPKNVFNVWIDWQYSYVKASYYNSDAKAPKYLSIQYVNNKVNPNTAAAKALGSSTPLGELSRFVRAHAKFPSRGQGSLGSYKAQTYDQLSSKASSTTAAPATGTQLPEDFTTLSISGQNGSVTFRAFITSFSDSFSIGWNDITYVGRQDTLKGFKGMTRGASLGFKVAAFNSGELSSNYGKLNTLVKTAGVGKPSGTYVIAPFCKITVGKWFSNTPVVFNSIKYDTSPADFTWDIDAGVPMLIDVSVDFAVLGDVTGNSLNSAGKFIAY